MDHWRELCRLKANENAPNNFCDAVEILLNKPHVANKRLCGKNILYRERHTSIKSLSEAQLSGIIERIRDNWPLLNIHKVDSFINEILPEADILVEPYSKKSRISIDKSYSESNHQENIEVIVRELLPKRADIYDKIVELVILDDLICKATFIPLANVSIACDKSTFLTPNKEIVFWLQLQNLWLTAYVKERNSETHSEENQSTPVKTLAFSRDYVKDKLIQQILGWLSQKSLDVKEKSLTQINIERYNEVYHELKTKYGNDLVKNWPMTTDPQKFVFEDIAIASYLLVLWEEERKLLSSDVKQTFVDLGCGNGLLVHLLSSEGHPGTGIDIRKREIWNMYGESTNLQEMAITPSDSNLFPNCDWLIGNHSDELTPWIPIIAARSSFSCRFFVLPCCPWDFDRKFSEKGRGTSLYGRYLEFVKQLTELCGFCVKTDNLRIPSTKKVCIIGHKRNYLPEDKDLIDNKIKDFIDQRCAHSKGAQKCMEVELSSQSEGIPQRTVTEEILCTDCDSEKHRTLNSVTDSVVSATPCKKCEDLREQFRKEDSRSAKQGTWVDTFQARNKSEVPRNCSRIDLGVKNLCITTVTNALLATENMKQLEDGRMWNKGGQIKLSDVAAMFDKDTLGHMKNECGGVQTLLKSSHHIFRVQKGCVELRDWSTADEVHFLAKRKKKGKKQQDMQRFWKTKLCWFHTMHPGGCPRPEGSCLFAHSEDELKSS